MDEPLGEKASLLSKDCVCGRLGVSPRGLENLVRAGEFPPPVRLGKRVYWSDRAVERWLRRLVGAQEAWSPIRMEP